MTGRRNLKSAALAALAAGLLLGAPEPGVGADCKRSQDCALDAFKNGEIKPLTDVLAAARAQIPGEVVKIELDREDGLWIYEIKILTPSGKRRKIEINASTLAITKME